MASFIFEMNEALLRLIMDGKLKIFRHLIATYQHGLFAAGRKMYL
jgi:hypothetical protein